MKNTPIAQEKPNKDRMFLRFIRMPKKAEDM